MATCVFASERQMLRPHEWIDLVRAAENELRMKVVVQKLQVNHAFFPKSDDHECVRFVVDFKLRLN